MTHDFKAKYDYLKEWFPRSETELEALRIMSEVQDGKLLLVKTDGSEQVVPKYPTKVMRETIFTYSNAPLVESEIHDLWDAVLSAAPKVVGVSQDNSLNEGFDAFFNRLEEDPKDKPLLKKLMVNPSVLDAPKDGE